MHDIASHLAGRGVSGDPIRGDTKDLIWRSLSIAWFPSIKEPQGLLRADGKRPHGLRLAPWKGRFDIWDVTVTDAVAASYLSATFACAGSAAEAAAKRKEDKYAEIS